MRGPAARRDARHPFFVMEESGGSRLTTLHKQTQGDGLLGLKGGVPPKGEELRNVMAHANGGLVEIHSNPCPSKRKM